MQNTTYVFIEIDKIFKNQNFEFFFWGDIGLLIFFLNLDNVLKAAVVNVYIPTDFRL